jgi:hypothetical protein
MSGLVGSWMSPGAWFSWVILAATVYAFVLLCVFGLCVAASDADDTAAELFARDVDGSGGSLPSPDPDDEIIRQLERQFHPSWHWQEDPASRRTKLTEGDE